MVPDPQAPRPTEPAGGDRRGPGALRRRLAIIGFLLVLTALLSAGALVWNRHEATLAAARDTAADLALVFARQADGAIAAVDVPLAALQRRISEDDLAPGSLAVAAHMHAVAGELPHQEILVATDPAGHILIETGPVLPCTAGWLARVAPSLGALSAGVVAPGGARSAGIVAPGGALSAGMVASGVSRRVTSADCGAAEMAIARPLANSRGTVTGLLFALIQPRDLFVLPQGIDLPDSGAIVLFAPHGLALLAAPSSAAVEPALALRMAGYGDSFPVSERFTLAARGEHAARLVALHALAVPSLAVVFSIGRAQALAGWRSDSRVIGLGTLICLACVTLLLQALREQIHRVDASQTSLAAANDELCRKSRELEITLTNMEQGLVMLDRDQRVAVFNARAAELLALPEELLAARPSFNDLLRYQWEHDEFVSCPDEIKTRMLAGVRLDQSRVYERRRPDGRLLEVRNQPLGDGRVVRTYTDVTQRALEEQRFRQIVTVSPLAIALLDAASGRIEHVNPACCTLLGRPPEGLVERSWTDFVHPDDRAEVPPRSGADTRLLTGDGRIVLARLSVSPLPGGGKAAPLLLVIGEDVTRQREMEVRLHQAQRLETVGQLTGGVAHDFNNLLGIITLDAELLAAITQTGSQPARLAGEILDAASSGAELTRRLLAFARRQPLQPRVIALDEAVEQSARLLRRTLGDAIKLTTDMPPGLWPVSADPAQLAAALLNLALNARDAMQADRRHGSGQIVITASNGPPGAEESGADLPEGDYVCLTFSDNGSGMSHEVLERAVEPFFSTKPPGIGSGLGLSMIYGFARQSGGTLTIDSAPGQGTTVRLVLPRAPREALPAASTAAPPVPDRAGLPGGRETILLVDDNDAVRHIAARQLAGLGYRVIEAAGGAEALEKLRGTPAIDLLFTDLLMAGGMNGMELARAARRDHPALKLLYTSGFTRAEDEEPAPLIRKPYRRRILAEKIRAALNG